jgi:hypothetical protein
MKASQIYNIIAVIFGILAVAIIGFIVVNLLSEPEEELVALPTPIPSFTPTPTVTPTFTSLPPSFTPTPTFTYTPSNTPTETPSITPSPTITDTPGPTNTPSLTPTPSISPTFTPSFTPTGPTETYTPSTSPFPFALRGNITLTTNFANPSAGCAWQGIGGSLLDLNGNPLTGNFQVRVFNNQFEETATIGSNTLYGEVAGWEVKVADQVIERPYFVRLETINNVPISPDIQVVFPGTCEQNAALVTFIQTRPFP